MYRVIIADDHELTRRGVLQVLSESHEFDIIGEAVNGNQAWEMIQALQPDIALLDIRMEGLQGPAVCRLVKDAHLPTACIILSGYTDDGLLRSALANGARGYIIKDVSSGELVDSIRKVLTRGAVLDPKLTARVIQWVEEDHLQFPARLKPVDIHILSLVAEGFTNKEIGTTLNLSANTIKVHINTIVENLGAKNRVEAAVIAYRQGII